MEGAHNLHAMDALVQIDGVLASNHVRRCGLLGAFLRPTVYKGYFTRCAVGGTTVGVTIKACGAAAAAIDVQHV